MIILRSPDLVKGCVVKADVNFMYGINSTTLKLLTKLFLLSSAYK